MYMTFLSHMILHLRSGGRGLCSWGEAKNSRWQSFHSKSLGAMEQAAWENQVSWVSNLF